MLRLNLSLFRLLAHAKVQSVKSVKAAQQRGHVKSSWWSFGWFVLTTMSVCYLGFHYNWSTFCYDCVFSSFFVYLFSIFSGAIPLKILLSRKILRKHGW